MTKKDRKVESNIEDDVQSMGYLRDGEQKQSGSVKSRVISNRIPSMFSFDISS